LSNYGIAVLSIFSFNNNQIKVHARPNRQRMAGNVSIYSGEKPKITLVSQQKYYDSSTATGVRVTADVYFIVNG